MKRIAVCLVILALVMPMRADCLSTGASAVILMDAESGRILYEKNPHQTRLIASVTKLMTALVAVERCGNLQEKISVPPEWVGAEGSSIYLRAGEEITFETLLYGMLLQSGNDAAQATACWIAGDEKSFARLMNEKAARLGMVNSSFANASGLDAEGHYSTAYDMALLACACLKNEVIAKACATRSVTIGTRTFVNHNKLLWRDPDCIGMKTGYTEKAGRTLVSAARREGQTLVCVTLNDGDDWNDHEKLFEYGFSQFPRQELCREGQVFGRIPVTGSLLPFVQVRSARSAAYPLKEGESLSMEVTLQRELAAPVKAGTCVGKAVWMLGGRTVAETDLICVGDAGLNVWSPGTLKERLFGLFCEEG